MTYHVSYLMGGEVKTIYSGSDLTQANRLYNWAVENFGNANLIRR